MLHYMRGQQISLTKISGKVRIKSLPPKRQLAFFLMGAIISVYYWYVEVFAQNAFPGADRAAYNINLLTWTEKNALDKR